MAKKGLKQREPNGREQRLSEEGLKAANQNTVVTARVRHYGAIDAWLKDEDGRKVRINRNDPLWGSALGRLYAHQVISYEQHEALLEYGRRRTAYLQIKVAQKPNPSSPGFVDASRGSSCAPEMDPDLVTRITRQHGDMTRELEEMERLEHLDGLRPRILDLMALLDRLTIYDREIAITVPNAGAVRSAANLLARMFKV